MGGGWIEYVGKEGTDERKKKEERKIKRERCITMEEEGEAKLGP